MRLYRLHVRLSKVNRNRVARREAAKLVLEAFEDGKLTVNGAARKIAGLGYTPYAAARVVETGRAR